MGAFNTLKVTVICEKCKQPYGSRLQFKAGEIWLNEYSTGDFIKIDQRDKKIENLNIIADAILEDEKCPSCGFTNFSDFDVVIHRGKIVRFEKQSDTSKQMHVDYFNNLEQRHYYIEK